MSINEIQQDYIKVIATTESQPGTMPALQVELGFKRVSRSIMLTIKPMVGDGASLDTSIVFPAGTVPEEFRPSEDLFLFGPVQVSPGVLATGLFKFNSSGGIDVKPIGSTWTNNDAGFVGTVIPFQVM